MTSRVMPIYEQPHTLAALDDELGEATMIAHARIADTYLAYFGGLDTGLRDLGENPVMAGIDGGYPLRHLARHLLSACRAADLHRLLAAEHSTNDHGATNVWFAAHDLADCVLSYLSDLAQARHDSAVSTDEALTGRQPATSLGMEIRYALMAASIAGRTSNVSAGLLEQLTRTRVWSPNRSLDHARRLTDPRSRLDALVTVHRHLSTDDQSAVLAQALTAAAAIPGDSHRAASASWSGSGPVG